MSKLHDNLTFSSEVTEVLVFGFGLELFKRGKKDFLCRYATMDETWIHHDTPETKRSSAESLSEDRYRGDIQGD